MRQLRVFGIRLRSMFRRGRQEEDLAREFEIHLEELTRELVASGMSETAARREAMQQFGPRELLKEECRDIRQVHLVENLVRDIGFSIRLLRKSPGFTLTAVASL